MKRNIGIVSPGEMGSLVAHAVASQGHNVLWASSGRSARTYANARRYGIQDVVELIELCANCDIIFSICPPSSAFSLASKVLESNFSGIYVDVTSLSEASHRKVHGILSKGKISLVDASIVIASDKNSAVRMFLSGPEAKTVARCICSEILPYQVLGDKNGTAISVKVCLDSYLKGVAALRMHVLATAQFLEVDDILLSEWSRGDPSFLTDISCQIRKLAIKSCRFAEELDEFAVATEEAGIPNGIPLAASRLFHKLSELGYESRTATVSQILTALRNKECQGNIP